MKTARPGPPAALRLTPQRAEILRLLEGNKAHPSAEDIYARLRRKFPGVSFATVYNTLQALLARGELAEIKIDPARARFDPCTGRHAHLMCVKCGVIADVRVPPRPPVPGGKPRGFAVLHCTIEFYGVCPACGRKAAPRKRKRRA
jgi:Fur family peroxide stress response transcriptional regulator